MMLTKYTHACVRLEKDGTSVVLDPGNFSEVEEAVSGAAAILITHEHADHFDRDRIATAVRADPTLEVYAPEGVAAQLREALDGDRAADRVHSVEPEQSYTIAGFSVQTFGGQHALIHPHIPVVRNIGYLINGALYHPGDSFIVPHGVQVQTLLVPVHAPWSKTAEVIDFVTAVRAPRAHQIHDALLNGTGLAMVEGHVSRLGKHYGTDFEHLEPGQSVEI
ncbi:MBL fold metallo-hydrolase [Arthrobacter tumbae]|uniref:MBL fold metallo-hydrolase n=1 Tax=Arthrobacter tumbae TaxID=163874 RepID=UPI00195EF523|nr:MBL fold metallo-hydrolase [Arthrobacter tumbae]MBM7780064.1 L-ascorbate metabolism protein UlaG (beta-lactamase superfamily) [Arthrobacter tumbae]